MNNENKKLPLSFGAQSHSTVVLPAVFNLSIWVEVFDFGGSSVKYLVDYFDTALPTVDQFKEYEERFVHTKV